MLPVKCKVWGDVNITSCFPIFPITGCRIRLVSAELHAVPIC